MFNIDIASLRDPATLARIKEQVGNAAALVSAYEGGSEDAKNGDRFGTSLEDLKRYMAFEDLTLSRELQQRLSEAYNLGWDTVRLHSGARA